MNLSILLSTMRVQMKQSFARPMFRFCLLANPILNTILLYEMYRGCGEDNFMAYVVLGSGLMGLWGCICFSSAGDINRERYSGTLALIFAAPARFPAIILGKIIGNTLMSLLTLGISLVTAVVLFRIPLMLASPLYFLLALSAVFGIFGLTVGLVLFVSQLCALYSYGTEFTAPFSPAYSKGFVESLIELPIFRRDTRPEYYEPIDLIRMK